MNSMAPTTGRPPKTVADYMALPDDVRAELISGELYVTPSPTSSHQTVVQRLHLVLAPFVETEGLGRVHLAPLDVHLPTGDIVQPDVLFVGKDNLEIIQDWIHGVPDLVVEVVSRTHAERDRIVKRGVYERAEVPEYWLVDPGSRSVEVFRLAGHAYRPAGYHEGRGAVRSPLLPGLAVDVERLFG
jgi:Uma2 family endonuclease